MRTRLSCDGETLDETAYVYDQAFVLLALARVSHAFSPPLSIRPVRSGR